MAIQTRITQRFDILSNWIQNDIVLLKGELAVVDCGNQTRFKVGDGTKRFTQLPFVDQNQLCTRWIAADAMSQGLHASSIPYGFTAGAYLCANASFSQALGFGAKTISSDTYSFVWNGDDTRAIEDYYTSHGKGTFSVNPLSGLSGIFIGEQNLAEVLDENSGSTITIDDQISGICKEKTDLSIVKLSAEDYADLVASDALLSDVLYVVEGSYEDVYGQQVKNMAPGTDLSDAVNLEQLAEVSARAYDTYTQTEVDQKIASAQYFKKYVVQTLPPIADADERGIYLVPSTDSQLSNTYDEYVVVGEGAQRAWEKIGAKNIDLSGYKTKQTAKTSPTASGTTTAFIDTISQDENGVITATKKNAQAASTSQAGIVQLNNTLTSTSTAQAATANAVKLTNDKFADYSLTSHVHDQYLTAVPSDYKTYAQTKQSLSADGYATQEQLNEKSTVSVDNVKADANLLHISQEDYNQLVADDAALSNTMYVVSADYVETYGQQIKNVADPTDLSDAVNKEYVDSNFQPAGNYLTAVPSAYKTYAATLSSLSSTYSLTSHTHSGYVPTSRTVAGMQLTGNVTLKNLSFGSKNYNGSTALTVTAGDLGALTAHQPISAVYADQHIRLSANNVLVGNIDCSDFIKDGMLSTVELCSDQLIFIFNAESGKTAISVALSNFIDETNYYTKAELTGTTGVLKGYSLTSHTHTGYVPTSRTVAGQQLTANVTAATISSAIGLNNYALDSNALHKTSDETATGKKTFSDAFTVGTRKSGTYGTKSFTYGLNNLASGEGSFAGGQNCVASEAYAVAEGYQTSALGLGSHAEGQNTLAKGGSYCSHAEGYKTVALNGYAHAEGYQTSADFGSHAEGSYSFARSIGHAEGDCTYAIEYASHAENGQTSALYNYTHAEGYGTLAQNVYEHAQGIYNVSNKSSNDFHLSSNTIDSIGIGTANAHKNATEVMQNGDAYFLGVGGYDGTNAVSATSKPLAAVLSSMKSYADTKASLSTDGYATQSQLDTKSSISVDSGFAPTFKFEHISLEDYISKSISGIVDGNTLYDISSENMTVFDQKIVDLAPGEDPTDAPNMSQLTEVSARACDTYTQAEVDQKITEAEAGYKLVNAAGVLSSGSYVYEVQDKAMTTISINQSSTPVVVMLPSASSGARDFILRIEISSASAPTFTFTNTSGLDFESEDDDWAVMEPGVNLVSFTETKR